jgi:hypothetical protein
MTLFRSSSILRLGLAWVLIVGVSMGQAQSTTSLDKHARKVHHKLAKYSTGRYLHLMLRDHSDSYGALGTLSENSFTFTSAESNSTATYSYNDIERVKTDKEPIGKGTEPRYHIRHLVPIVITAAALGAAGAVYAAER